MMTLSKWFDVIIHLNNIKQKFEIVTFSSIELPQVRGQVQCHMAFWPETGPDAEHRLTLSLDSNKEPNNR